MPEVEVKHPDNSVFFAGVRSARTTVQSVPGSGMKVEIDCVARVTGVAA